MSDLATQSAESQIATPGALLRTVAESQAQDPSKVPASAQIGSATRSLVQEPATSTIPGSTPRVLNVVGSQTPAPDYTGLHSMLASAPVPPTHVAASLIRALMTPPSGVVHAQQPVIAQPEAPAQAQGQPSSASSSNTSVSAARPAMPVAPSAPSTNSRPSSSGVFGPQTTPSTPVLNRPTLNFGPAQQAHSSPNLFQNLIGNRSFIGGTVGDALAGVGGLSGLISRLGGLFTRGLGAVNQGLEDAQPLMEDVAQFIP